MEGKLLPGPSLKQTTMKGVPFSLSFAYKKRKKEKKSVSYSLEHLNILSLSLLWICVNISSPYFPFLFFINFLL